MREMFARMLRGVWHVQRHVLSRLRKSSLRLRYPTLEFRGEVFISTDCDIRVGRSSRMVIDGCFVSRGVTIIAGANAWIDVGADFIGRNTMIVARESISIGEGSKIAENVVVRDGNHDHSVALREMKFTQHAITIGPDVWLGASCIVLGGVNVHEGATVGAGAVVTKDVSSFTTVAGVPARPVNRTTH